MVLHPRMLIMIYLGWAPLCGTMAAAANGHPNTRAHVPVGLNDGGMAGGRLAMARVRGR